MLFPIIKVKDNDTGHEHIVGTNSHDTLLINDGKITYYNLQNGEGSEYGTYSFLGVEDDFSLRVEFVSYEEFQKINAREKAEELARRLEREALLKKLTGRPRERKPSKEKSAEEIRRGEALRDGIEKILREAPSSPTEST